MLTHGAANIKKSSELLNITRYQHCTAHALHLLLSVGSIHQIDEIVQVLQRCREIVTTLHFIRTLEMHRLWKTVHSAAVNSA